ncbi:MAG TPA: methionyl-tRNA formyltransferase [Lentimicrobium sp.]|nr:methionyl-tRNA formyltransferase [Lentimicrobium sp.]
MNKDRTIVYMGTPDFAVEPLKKLIEQKFNVSAVVTVADKPSGRGLKMHASPVKEFAVQHGIKVLQPLKLNDPDFLNELKKLNADLFIVVAFRKLPEAVWKLPPLGCFNLHASLLPQYRGAAPINHAVINGETMSGVTTFFLDEEIDTGKIILRKEVPVGADETAGELHDKLMVTGAQLVIDTVNAIFNGNYQLQEQPKPVASGDQLRKAPKIFRNDCRINWQQKALTIHNFIRGLSPYPGAYGIMRTSQGESELKVLKSTLTDLQNTGMPGDIRIENNKLFIGCQDHFIEIITVQPSGKKAMAVSDFLRGLRSEISIVF